MSSKNDPKNREKSTRPKPKGRCGHDVVRVAVYRVKGGRRMQWYCERDGLL